jgi:hypothetical protein
MSSLILNIFKRWLESVGKANQENDFHTVLAVKDNLGIARWQSKFTEIESGKRLELDHLFTVEFDQDGKYSLLRQWWHLHTIESGADGEVIA